MPKSATRARPVLSEELAAQLRGRYRYAAALDHALRHLKADSGTIHVLGDDGHLHLKAYGPLPPGVRAHIARIPVGRGMAGQAVELAAPVTWCNLQQDGTGVVRAGAKATGLEGSIVVPLLRGGKAVGALGVANRSERTFTPAETEFLLELGRALADR